MRSRSGWGRLRGSCRGGLLDLGFEPDGDAAQGAFNAFCGEAGVGEGSDFFGGKAVAVVEPKDEAVALSEGTLSGAEFPIKLGEEDGLVHGGSLARAGGGGGGGFVVEGRGDDFAAALGGVLAAEVVVSDGGGDDAEETEEGVVSAGLEVAQDAAFLLAELEEDFLGDFVDDGGLGTIHPHAANAEGDEGNEGSAAAQKLLPLRRIGGAGAGLGEIVDRGAGVVHSAGDQFTARAVREALGIA